MSETFQNLIVLSSFAAVARASVRGEHTSRLGNKKLKRSLFLSAYDVPPPAVAILLE